jgi:hypothetical protein
MTQSLTQPPAVHEHEHLKSNSLQVTRTKRRLKSTSIVQDLFGLINQVTSHKILGVDRVTSKQSPHEFVFPVPGALDYYVSKNNTGISTGNLRLARKVAPKGERENELLFLLTISLQVRYEDLIRTPREALATIYA